MEFRRGIISSIRKELRSIVFEILNEISIYTDDLHGIKIKSQEISRYMKDIEYDNFKIKIRDIDYYNNSGVIEYFVNIIKNDNTSIKIKSNGDCLTDNRKISNAELSCIDCILKNIKDDIVNKIRKDIEEDYA